MTTDDSWKADEKVAPGGLMRCCLQSIAEHLADMTEVPKDGTVLDCKYEKPGNENIVRRDGVWCWSGR